MGDPDVGWLNDTPGLFPAAYTLNNLLACTVDDPTTASSNQALTGSAVNGTAVFNRLNVYAAGLAYARAFVNVQALAVTPTAGGNQIGVYLQSSATLATLVALSADLGTWTTTGPSPYALTAQAGTQGLVTNGILWSAVLSVAATPVTLKAAAGTAGAASIGPADRALGGGGTSQTLRVGTIAAQTALPATFNPSTLATTNLLVPAIGLGV